MKRKSRFFFPKNILRRLILILGTLLGFTSAIVAQYGVIEATYKIKGIVKSKDCETPIPRIKVSLYNNMYQPNYDPYTDSLGRFELYFSDNPGENNIKMIIEAEDEDGDANGGNFLTYEKIFLTKQKNTEKSDQYSYSHRYDYESDDIIIEMDRKGKSPCKTELPEDSIPVTIPPIQKLCVLTDSNITNPIKTDILSNIQQDSADTLNNGNPSEQAEMADWDLFVVYPNPSNGQYIIKLSLESSTIVSATVYDSDSQLLLSESWERCEGRLQKQINLENYAPGTYYLFINAGNQQYTAKLIKQ